MTKKGNKCTRAGRIFCIHQEILFQDQGTSEHFQSESITATLGLPLWISKGDAWRMLHSWLCYYEDDELVQQVWEELCALYSPQVPQLPPVTKSDDKDMN